MKKLLTILALLSATFAIHAQEERGFLDYGNGDQFTINGITYIVNVRHDKSLLKDAKRYRIFVHRIDDDLKQFETFGEYADGTFNDDPELCTVEILHRQEIPLIIHSAWKKAFSKEERNSHPEITIWAFPILNMQGKIVAMAFSIPIFRDYVIQPEQIATLDRELRANLQFELKIDETNKFVRIPGQFGISFKGLSKMLDIDVTPNPDNQLLYPTPSAGGGKTSKP